MYVDVEFFEQKGVDDREDGTSGTQSELKQVFMRQVRNNFHPEFYGQHIHG